MLPWFERPIIYDVMSHPQVISSQTGTRGTPFASPAPRPNRLHAPSAPPVADLQTINISLRILYRPDPENLVHIYRDLGKDYDQRVLPSIVNEVLKNTIVRVVFREEQLPTPALFVARLPAGSVQCDAAAHPARAGQLHYSSEPGAEGARFQHSPRRRLHRNCYF